MNFEMLDTNNSGTVIKVVGVGGAGGNAVAHMIRSGISGVEFICANTDAQALAASEAPVQIRLGRTGLGAGAKPDQGRAAAETAREEIRAALNGANMVFITAGMGGGTGTGAGPVVAEVAKELGILTVGVVTKPFSFEGSRRLKMAEEGIADLAKHVHSLIVVLNENLYDLMDEDATQEDCFKAADDVLRELGMDNDPLLKIAKRLEQIALEDDYFIQRKLYPNVDFYSGIILKALGIPTSMFTVIFALGRTPGWIAHWNEMISGSFRIGRPRQLYTGAAQRDFVELKDRD